jgi:hypothetical protein
MMLLELHGDLITISIQSLAVASKATFRNCLVAMRPKTTKSDLPSTHDVTTYIHNEFVRLLEDFKTAITVRLSLSLMNFAQFFFQAAPGKVSITVDGWSADTTKAAFLGMTGHWIEVNGSNWVLRSNVLAFRGISGQHSGENLGKYVVGLSERVGIITAKSSKVRESIPLTYPV